MTTETANLSVFDTGIYKAVEKAGNVPKLAHALGVARQNVYAWLKRGWVPPARAIQIEEFFGVPRDELMDPSLRKVLTGTLNEAARMGRVEYRPRRRPTEESADLV